MRVRRTLLMILLVLLLVGALGMIAYPLISDYLTRQQNSAVIAEVSDRLQEADTDVLAAEKAAADAYNRQLAAGTVSMDGVAEADPEYPTLLNVGEGGIMGIVEIPMINVELPIYHGTEGDELAKGIGHLHGTSLPVGGESTHAVISGHSGMTGQRMLTDLGQLAEGDMFYLHVLGETLVYRVDQIKTVLPYQTEDLQIVPDEDHVTLLTCTPYGINTHRLLVRGVRITTDAAEQIADDEMQIAPTATATSSTWMRQYVYGILAGLAIVVGIGLLVLILYAVVRRIHRHAKH